MQTPRVSQTPSGRSCLGAALGLRMVAWATAPALTLRVKLLPPVAAEEPEPIIDVDAYTTQSTAGNKRRRKSTSPVWKHFEEIFEMRRGKEVRVDAMCKHCKKL